MNTKKQKVMAFVLSLVLVCSSFLEFVVPAQAADTGFAENAVIVSDTAAEYCWLNSEVNLSVNVIKGTELVWSIDRENAGVVLNEKEDVEDRTGIIKGLSVDIGPEANGSYKITANVGNDSRTITLNVCDSLSEIQGAVVTDFTNQYTENSFEVKAVIDPRYAESFTWNSADSTKVEVKPEEDKTSTTEYAGSVVKYAMVNIKSEKPENGVCDITATANNLVKTQTLSIRKSATNMKDLQVVATSYQDANPDFDLVTYNHMSSDALYVDMDEVITLTCVVEGTVVNPEVKEGAPLSFGDVDDIIGVSSTESATNKENTGAIEIGDFILTKINDTSYKVQFKLKGTNATKIENPIVFSVFTNSGKRSIRKNLIVLAPAMNVAFNSKDSSTGENLYVEEEHTNVGILEGTSNTLSSKDFNSLWTLKFQNQGYLVTQNNINVVGKKYDMTEGTERNLTAVFRSRFKVADNQAGGYICDSTDTPIWKSMDETIATVTNDGKIKAVKGGDTVIYCYAKPTKTSPRTDCYAYVYIHVTNINEAEGVNITREENGEQKVKAEDTIYTTQKNIQYSAQLIDGDATANEPVIWESSDTEVFEVGSTGLVNPKKAGTATLTVTTQKSGYQASIRITVKAAIESIKIPERDLTGTYVQNHTYVLTTELNGGEMTEPQEDITWTIEEQDENDPVVVFIDPNDSTKTELTKFVGRNVSIKIKKRGSAKVVVKGAVNASAIDTLNVTAIAERPATSTIITYNGNDCAGKEINVVKGTNVELKASLLAENGNNSTDDFYWNIVQSGEVVKTTNTSLKNVETLTLQPLTKGDAIIELRDVQTNKYLTVTLHVKVPATAISLEESQMNEVMLVPGEAGATYQLKPILTPEDSTDKVIYESSDPSIVKVDENGLLTAVKSSETPVTITAKINDSLKATCQARVAIPVTELKAEDADGNTLENNGVISVYKDETKEIKLNCGNATEYIEWTSASENIASVKLSDDTYSCTINGNIAGETTLTAVSSISKKKVTFTVKVVNRITSMLLTGSSQIAVDATNGYVSVSLPVNSDDVIWSVDNPEIIELTPTRNNNVARVSLTPKKVGKVVITATSADGLCTATKEIEITALNLERTWVTAINPVTYNGSEQRPKLTLTYNNVLLVEGEDYTATYSNNVNVGTASVTISEGRNGNYAGTRTINFQITPKDISSVQAAKINNLPYTGKEVEPKVNLTDSGKKLVENTDYEVSYTNNVNVGTATVNVRGKGNYTGSKQITYKITPQNISKVKVTKIANQKYTGYAIAPTLTVTNGTTKLSANYDYKVKFSSNKKPGKAKAVVTGIGNYAGSKTVYFYIAPAQAQLVSVTSTKAKTMKLKWKKDTKATGYEIYYSTKSNFAKKSRKVVTITKSKTTSKTIKKLKSNKTYYVKIRSYKK